MQALKERFYKEFENPLDSEPYDTHEGGYLNRDSFVDTDDAVGEVFHGELSESTRKDLISELNKESTIWKRKS